MARPHYYAAGKAAALTAITLLRTSNVKIPERERGWLDTMQDAAESLLARESEFINQMIAVVDQSKFVPADYGLA